MLQVVEDHADLVVQDILDSTRVATVHVTARPPIRAESNRMALQVERLSAQVGYANLPNQYVLKRPTYKVDNYTSPRILPKIPNC